MKFSGLSNQTISKEGDWDSNTFSKHICDHALPCKLCITLLLNTPLNFYLISNKYILHLAVIIARLFRVFILQRGKRKKKKNLQKDLGIRCIPWLRDIGVKSKSNTGLLTHVHSAASSLVFSTCQSVSDCLLFQSQFTSSLQVLAPLAGKTECKAGWKGRHHSSQSTASSPSSLLQFFKPGLYKDKERDDFSLYCNKNTLHYNWTIK